MMGITGTFLDEITHDIPSQNWGEEEWAADFDCETWAQFSLKFILSHPAVTCVLTETANPDHLVDNMAAGMGRLPDEATRQKMLELVQSFV